MLQKSENVIICAEYNATDFVHMYQQISLKQIVQQLYIR